MVFSTSHVPTKNPIVAAKESVTVDHISGGRFGLNMTMGWYKAEMEMFGRTQREHDARYRYGTEWITIAQRMWTEGEGVDFKGASGRSGATRSIWTGGEGARVPGGAARRTPGGRAAGLAAAGGAGGPHARTARPREDRPRERWPRGLRRPPRHGPMAHGPGPSGEWPAAPARSPSSPAGSEALGPENARARGATAGPGVAGAPAVVDASRGGGATRCCSSDGPRAPAQEDQPSGDRWQGLKSASRMARVGPGVRKVPDFPKAPQRHRGPWFHSLAATDLKGRALFFAWRDTRWPGPSERWGDHSVSRGRGSSHPHQEVMF